MSRAGRLGFRVVLLGLAIAAAAGGLGAQLAFAVIALAGLGLAHGASDLAVIAPERRASFLVAYLAVLAGVLAWWLLRPGAALPLFLALSALHFAWEDAPGGGIVPRLVHGLLPIAAPAVFHQAGLADLLARAGGNVQGGADLASALHWIGIALLPLAATMLVRRFDPRLAGGTAALLLLPPLVGFSLGFLVLHALPQTRERARQLGCPDLLAYHRRVLPLLMAATLPAGIGAGLLLRLDPSGVRVLFAAIAALAVPHMIVTPLFQRHGVRPRFLGVRPLPA